MDLELRYPFMLGLLVPAAFLIYLYFRRIHLTRTVEKTVVGILRSIIFLMLIFALAFPQLSKPVKEETVIFLADRSASFGDSEEAMINWINQSIDKKNGNQSYAVASFADGVSLERMITNRKTSLQQFGSHLKTGGTNLEEGIQFASSLFPKEEGGRIVLLTDGNETAGTGLEAANLLKNRKIEIDYAVLPREFREDMALTKFDVPPSLYEGEEAKLTVTIASNAVKQTDIRISVNNRDIIHHKVTVKEGQNEFSFSYPAGESGLAVYKAQIAAADDAFIENNTLYASSNIKGNPKVLIVQGNQKDSLKQILSASGLSVDMTTPEKLPVTLAGYLQYQSIIFNNIPATNITEVQMNLIEKAVKEFGTGFVMLGGEDSFGLGGYFKTPIEKLLPVDMDIKGKKELPSLGLVIVVDRSGSMAGSKLELAKEAAARSAELLREEDTLGFIAFDDRPWTIVKTAPLKDKKKVINKIRSVTVGGGTNIYPSLELAYKQLQDLELQRKHIILLTDGQSAAGGDYDALISDGKGRNITLSTVALGADADRNLLSGLAQKGSGRFYDVTDASVIPSILSRETVMTTRTYIEDHPFYPEIASYPEWTPLFKEGIPKMNAYIAVTPKQSAKIPIMSTKKDPILAEWQYGLGTTIAFTSDVTGKWSGDWAKWAGWPQFINQLAVKSLPSFDSEPYRFSIDKANGSVLLHIQTADSGYHPLDIAVAAQDGTLIDANSKPAAPGEYDVTFPDVPGMYFLRVKQTTDGQDSVFQTGFSVPYSDEYQMKGTNNGLLKEIALAAGGKELMSPKEAFLPLKDRGRQKQSISEELLLIAFFLLVLEIFLRRLGFKPLHLLRQKFWKRKTVTENTHSDSLKKMAEQVKLRGERERQVKENNLPPPPKNQAEAHQEQRSEKGKQTPLISSGDKEERLKRLLEAKKRKQ